MVTQVKKLMTKHAANRQQEAFGSWRPQFGSKQAASQEPRVAKRGEGIPYDARDGGNHPETHADDVAKREMIAIYNRYVAVYDKVSRTRRRKVSYRKPAVVMCDLNVTLSRNRSLGSLVERILREAE